MTPPSKELLSAVLDENIIESYEASGYIYYHSAEDEINGEKDRKINIHELAHKVKEWAYYEKNLSIREYLERGEWRIEVNIAEAFYAETSYSGVFKAAEWILNQQDKGI